ncbi:alpha/beta fold hydrolase [Ideonella benzenivorans]|uniref:alpha/beta fold hydrolase n=1 Tax=Ideonella benzenivorans TaxID=2831643 RepID=UPI001CECCB00|nr:alpha/beta fold hydrolase [Ideonella benzenivorans]
MRRMWAGLCMGGLMAVGGLARAATPADAAPVLTLSTCRLKGVEVDARCGVLRRPLDPTRPQGAQIDLQVAVLPAVARRRQPDPVVFLAGGPGQSAIELAGPIAQMMARTLNRRDVILVDQRGTGRSAPLRCDDDAPDRSLAEAADPTAQVQALQRCRARLEKRPDGDLRQFTTVIAMQDLDAVRQALGVRRWNLVGASYGTRAALEYLRQFPGQVRRVVLDGVAPPDMVLPLSFARGAQAALDSLFDDCARDPACRAMYPDLRGQWRALLASLPRRITVAHPFTGRPETFTLTRDGVASLVLAPLYAPITASALPLAVQQATQGRFEALVGLGAGALGGGRGLGLATGMHFSVVCAEDVPRMATAAAAPPTDFGDAQARLYRAVCQGWPRGTVPAAFYRVPPSTVPALLLSGAVDPATPPAQAERVARALGPQALSVVVPHTGHGVMALGCLRDVVFRFLDEAEDARALAQARRDSACAAALPRPPALWPLSPASAAVLEGGAR